MKSTTLHKLQKGITVILLCHLLIPKVVEAQAPISGYFRDNSYIFDGLDKIQQDDFFLVYSDELGLTEDDEIVVQECHNSEGGIFECRYRQYFQGYMVDGSSFVLQGQHGVVLYGGGNFVKNLAVDVGSPISESDALSVVQAYYSASTFDWEDSTIVSNYQHMMDDTTATLAPVGELVIAQTQSGDFSAEGYKLCWKFTVSTIDPTAMTFVVYVDAQLQEVYDAFDATDYGFASGDVETMYDGWKNFRTWHCGTCFGDWKLKSDNNIYTYQGNSMTILQDGDNNWSDPGERPTTTTHWALQEVSKYFYDRHGRAGSDNNWMEVRGHADYANPSTNYGGFNQNGGVDNVYISPRINNVSPAALDVIGHEYTHAFIARNPNLDPYKQNIDAGAINEGFADIFGLLAERKVRGAGHNWKVGDDIAFTSPTVKDFADPHSSTGPAQPNTYGESGYWDFTKANKHKNAGVLTRWFYLLSTGGTQNNVSVISTGIETADDIAFTTMMWWLWGTVNYLDTRNQSVNMAAFHYGKCSFIHKQLRRAWAAVGIGSPSDPTCQQRRIKGPYVVASIGNGIKFKIVNADETESWEDPDEIVWALPENWSYEISEDVLEVTLNDVGDMESQEIIAYVTKDSVTDTLRHIVHFSSEAPLKKIDPAGAIIEEAKSVMIFPNPTDRGSVSIALPDHAGDFCDLSIFSIEGKLIYKKSLKSKFSKVGTSELAPGTYIFRVIGVNLNESIRVIVNN